MTELLVMYPKLLPNFLNKVYPPGEYMSIWVRLEDTPSTSFMVMIASPTEDQLIRFHLYTPMGYVESADFFCNATEMFKDRVPNTISQHHNTPPQPIEALSSTPYLTTTM